MALSSKNTKYQKSRFPYRWKLKSGYPAEGVPYHGTRVLTTFACGGGSSMGYKLAGYDVVAANDIDPEMERVYVHNHHPKQFFRCSISDLLSMDLPKVDLLDGSPPCSTFSEAGGREENWGRERHFREGQAKQVLSELFFDFLKLVDKIRPKVVIAENVRGIIKGNAKGYAKAIVDELNNLGYHAQVFFLNSASMGVPQRRGRVFFIANSIKKKVHLDFNERPIPYKEIRDDSDTTHNLTPLYTRYWREADYGCSLGKWGCQRKEHPNKPCHTIIASSTTFDCYVPRHCNKTELSLAGSFPLDYDFLDIRPQYLIGMSVPPVMMANVAYEVYNQLLK